MAGTVNAPTWIASSPAGAQRPHISRFLDTVGDGSGTKNAIGDYSAAAEIFFIQPPASQVFRIARLLVTICDTNGSAAGDYGNITGGIANGVTVRHQNDAGTVTDYTDGVPVTDNASWTSFCYDGVPLVWGSGNDVFAVRWTFKKSGQYLRLDGAVNDRLEVVLNDDLRGLIFHRFLVQGYIE